MRNRDGFFRDILHIYTHILNCYMCVQFVYKRVGEGRNDQSSGKMRLFKNTRLNIPSITTLLNMYNIISETHNNSSGSSLCGIAF
jgi:hypothetical protein